MSTKEIAQGAGLTFVTIAVFPGLAARARRRGARRIALGVVGQVLFQFVILRWLKPWVDRQAARRERAAAELSGELGREPTEDEIVERLLSGARG